MSDCDLCIGGECDYDGTMEFMSVKEVRARKSFRCEECHRSFPAGAKYEKMAAKYDGDFCSVKTCLDCADIRTTFCCDGGIYGQLWQEWRDSEGFERLTTGCIAKLSTASAKQYLMDRWNNWKFSHLRAKDPA